MGNTVVLSLLSVRRCIDLLWKLKTCRYLATHCLDGGLKLAVEELQTVVKDILVGGVQAGLDAISHHVGCTGRTLQFQDLRETGHLSGKTEHSG